MKATVIAKGLLKALAVVLLITLIFYFFYQIRTVVAYVLIAAVVALIGRPIVLFLRRKLRFPNTLAVTISILTMLGTIIGIIAILIPLFTEQGENLSLLRVEDVQVEVDNLSRTISAKLGASSEMVEDIVEETDLEEIVLKDMDVDVIPSLLSSVIEILTSIGIGLFSVLFISFFFLKDSKLIQRFILKVVPKKDESKTVKSIGTIKILLSRYFVGLILQMAILFILYSITLSLVGIENAFVIAFLCALFNVIPYLGPMIGGFIMLALTLSSNLGLDFYTEILPKIGYVAIGITIGQLVDNFISQPLIFSNSVKSHPLEIFLIIIIAGLLFGVLGLIIAVPAYTVLKVILKEFVTENRMVEYLTREI